MNALIKVAALAAVLSASAAFAQDYPSTEPSAQGSAQAVDYSKLDANADGSISKDEAKADPTLSAKFMRARQGQEWYVEQHRVERCSKDK